jgi:hypothetical protein
MDNNNNLNNPNGTEPYGQPVDAGQGYQQPADKPKKPLGKGAVAGIIGGGVALVAAIVCGIIFIPKLFKSDKEVVLDAFANTFAASESTSGYFEETFGSSEIQSKAAEEGFNYGMELNLDSIQGVEEFGGLSVSFDTNADQETKQGDGSLVVTYNDTDVLNVGYYTDNDKIYVSLDNIVNGYFTLPCEGALDALAESALGEALEISDSGISGDIKFFQDDDATDTDEAASVNGDMVNAIEGIWDNTVFKKEGSAKIDVNGESVTAKEYTVTLGEEDLENALMDIYDAAMTEYQNMDDSNYEDSQTYLEQIKQMIPTVITGDFVLDVYIADGKVVKMTSEADTNIMGVKLSYDFCLDINDDLGGAFELGVMGQTMGISCDITDFRNAPNGEIKLYASDEEVVFDIESENKSTDSSLGFDGSLTCTYDDDTMFKMNMDYTLDTTSNAFSGNVELYVGDDENTVELAFDGQYVDIVKGQSYGCQMDNFKISMAGTELLSMSSKAKVGTAPEIKGIDSSLPTYDITAMTESDFQDVMEANSELSEEWMQTIENCGLGDLFNLIASGEDYIDDDYDDYYDDYYDDDDYDGYAEDMTSVLVSYDDAFSVEILGSLDGLEMTYGCEYFIDYDSDDTYVEYELEEDIDSIDDMLSDFSYYYEEDVIDSEYNQTITLSDGTTIGYDKFTIEGYDENYTYYYFVRDLGGGYVLTSTVTDYANVYSTEEAAETLIEQYFEIK